MSISVACPNGHKLNAKESLAGKTVRCPKCGTQVAIPSLDEPDLDGAANLLEELTPLSLDAAAEADPYALVPLESSPLGTAKPQASLAPQPRLPLNAPAPNAAQSLAPVNGPRIGIAVAAGGGLAVGLLVVAVVGWLLFGGSRSPARAVAQATTKAIAPPLPAPPISPVATAVAGGPSAAVQSTAPVVPAFAPLPEFVELQPATSPADLIAAPTEGRAYGFKLPAISYAAAYDEVSGRLAIAHDDHGVLIYDIDDVAAGKPAPLAILPTDGVPSAIGFKPLADRRVFLISGKRVPSIHAIDADTLEEVGNVRLSGNVKYVDFLTGSRNPQDPFVYYTNQNDRSQGTDEINRLGRINLVTMKLDGQTGKTWREEVHDVFPSADGSLLYFRKGSAGCQAVRWPEQAGDPQDVRFEPAIEGGVSTNVGYVPHPFGQSVAIGRSIVSPLLRRRMKYAEFEPKAYFRSRPLAVGLFQGALVIGSANDYRVLESIPLPGDWFPQQNTGFADFRWRSYLVESFHPHHVMVEADERRQIALAMFGPSLAIVRLGSLHLPQEKWLLPRNRPPVNAYAGREVSVELDSDVENVQIEVLTSEEQVPDGERLRYPLIGAPPPRADEPQLELAAAVNARQTMILVNDLTPLQGFPLPQQIMIGKESMKVVAMEDFKGALIVERSQGVAHSVSSRIVHVKPTQTTRSSDAPLPTITGRTFRWTPGADQLGPRVVRLRATAGESSCEWYWEFNVERDAPALPYFATGVDVSAAGDLAAVWGQSPPAASKPAHLPDPERKFFLGVYDLKQRRLVRHREVPIPIMTATVDPTGVYATLNQLTPQNERNIVPTELVKFRLNDLEIETQVTVPTHCRRLQVVAGRYLAALGNWSHTHRFTIPDLKPAEPEIPAFRELQIAGRVGNGWVWDGVLWDGEMKSPKLLLFPLLFGVLPGQQPNPVSAGELGQIRVDTHGAFACNWFSNEDAQAFPLGYPLLEYPATLRLEHGALNLYSWAHPPLTGESGKRPVATTQVVAAAQAATAEKTPGGLSASAGSALVAFQGQLHLLAYDKLLPADQPFRFQEQQSTFVLNASKPTVVRYNAPGARRYHLHLHMRPPGPFYDQPSIAAESSDGEFTIDLKMSDQLASNASESIGQSFMAAAAPPAERVAKYVAAVSPAFQSLTGRKPQGVPFAVYATVVAESKEGTMRAGLAHTYLVEAPSADVQRLIEQ